MRRYLTYARDRSHDQYYYARVADIVTGHVRVPEVHLGNLVIARRHVHALTLQDFFQNHISIESDNNLLGAFGSVGTFRQGSVQKLRELLRSGAFRTAVETAANRVVRGHAQEIAVWLDTLPNHIEAAIAGVLDNTELLTELINHGVLPRYAFPVDLVALWIEKPTRYNRGEEVQRDLSIALSEYAPGSEVIIDGKIHESAGLYTRYKENPGYEPTFWFYECPDCHNLQVVKGTTKPDLTACKVCRRAITGGPGKGETAIPAIEPEGFRTDWGSKPKKYRGGGREQTGFAGSAQLHAGDTASHGKQLRDGRLWVHYRNGDLYMSNRGKDEEPGFWICPRCGRGLDKKNQKHTVPEYGHQQCLGHPEQRSVLLHHFQSDVALVTVQLPETLDASPQKPRGRAAWLSLGHALVRAAAAHLQINVDELAVGMRPWRDPLGRLQGEIYLYDTLPNGAGYAEEVSRDIEIILEKARELCQGCIGHCETSCYSCLLDYGNQRHHALLDRFLALDLINYALDGTMPTLTQAQQLRAVQHLAHFVRQGELDVDTMYDGTPIPGVLRRPSGNPIGLWPLHTLMQAPDATATQVSIDTGVEPYWPREFDLVRRPYWVRETIAQGDRDSL